MHSLTSAIRRLVYHSFLLEIDPHGGYESGVEGAVRVLVEEARLADAGVPERQELHQVVVIHSGYRQATRVRKRACRDPVAVRPLVKP